MLLWRLRNVDDLSQLFSVFFLDIFILSGIMSRMKEIAIKKDIKHYFEIFWPQIDEDFKKLMVEDIRLIIDGKFDDVPRKVEWNERNK